MKKEEIDEKINTLGHKFYFSIKEVSDFCQENQSVLRYWEQEFSQIKPKKIQTQRRYQKRDIAIILTVQYLLRNDGLSIEAVKQYFINQKKDQGIRFKPTVTAVVKTDNSKIYTANLEKIKIELQRLWSSL